MNIQNTLCYNCQNFTILVTGMTDKTLLGCKVKSYEWHKENVFPIPLLRYATNYDCDCDDFIEGDYNPVFSLHGDLESHYENDPEYWIDIQAEKKTTLNG